MGDRKKRARPGDVSGSSLYPSSSRSGVSVEGDDYGYEYYDPEAAAPAPVGGHTVKPLNTRPALRGDDERGAAPPAAQPKSDRLIDANHRRPRCRDVLFLVLFLINFGGFIAVLVLYYKSSIVGTGASNVSIQSFVIDTKLVPIWLVCLAIGFVWSWVWLLLTRAFTRVIIIICMVLTILMLVGLGIWIALVASWYGLIMILFGLFLGFLFWTWRSRIPFSTYMLNTVLNIIFRFPATMFVAFVFLVIQVAFLVAWIIAASGTSAGFTVNRDNFGVYIVLSIFLLFTMYWTTQVLSNIVHVGVSGTFATWYFYGTGNTPPHPTASSAKRALTTSLGSICLGSLIIALLKTLRALIYMFRSQRGGFIALCIDCILSCIDSLIQYFNLYAFAQVAIYGKSYCEAAKDTWQLVKTRGVDAIINDNLISGVLTFGAIFAGIIAAIVAGLWVKYGTANATNGSIAFAVVIGFLIASTLVGTFMSVVESGVATIFVAFAEDPDVLRTHEPELHSLFVDSLGVNRRRRRSRSSEESGGLPF